MKNSQLYAVIPAFDEEIDMPLWLESVYRSKWKTRFEGIIVVNDGSTDRTLKKIDQYKDKLLLRLVSYSKNQGPGYALREGLNLALKIAKPDSVIVTMECDNTSNLTILDKMIDKIREGADVCVSSYYTKGGGVSNSNWWRSLVSRCGNLVITLGCDIRGVKTFSSFYRVYRWEALKRLSEDTNGQLFVENGFAHTIELLARLYRLNMKLTEIPLFLVNSNRKGKSHMKIMPTIIGYFRVIWYYRLFFRSSYLSPGRKSMKSIAKEQVVVVGMGYVGFPLACLLANCGYRVKGIDVNDKRISEINQGILPFVYHEEEIKELFRSANLKAGKDFTVCRDADIVIIAVQTPVSDKNHRPNYRPLKSALKSLGKNLKNGALVIVESTIAPRTTEKLVVPILEKYSRRKAGVDFFVAHCPERISASQAINKLRQMSRVIGGHTKKAGEMAKQVYQKFVESDIHVVDALTAEVTKTAENTYRDVQIAFANELESICLSYGVDFWQVRDLINRVPERFLHQAGPGVGGHCIPKDPWLLISGVNHNQSHLIRTARRINENRPRALFDRIQSVVKQKIAVEKVRISLLGVAYFSKTDDIRNSPTLELAKILKAENIDYRLHDSEAPEYRGDLMKVIGWANVVVIMTGHDEYRLIPKSVLADKLVFDPRHVL